MNRIERDKLRGLEVVKGKLKKFRSQTCHSEAGEAKDDAGIVGCESEVGLA
jgi:hypothetical protein